MFRGEKKGDVVKECGICYEQFKDDDEIVECILLHVFHTKCFDENKID